MPEVCGEGELLDEPTQSCIVKYAAGVSRNTVNKEVADYPPDDILLGTPEYATLRDGDENGDGILSCNEAYANPDAFWSENAIGCVVKAV